MFSLLLNLKIRYFSKTKTEENRKYTQKYQNGFNITGYSLQWPANLSVGCPTTCNPIVDFNRIEECWNTCDI